MPGKAQQEVFTQFGFTFDRAKFAGIQQGVNNATRNLGVIAARTDGFQQKMGAFFARAKGVIGAYLGFRAVRAITSDYAAGADAVAKFSAGLSLNTQRYQGLVHAVQLGGSDQETLNKALGQLSKRALEASQGLITNVRAFREAGIEWKDAQGNLKGADQLFLELADGLNNLDDSNKAAGLSMQLMGRTGLKLRNTMQAGSKAIKEQIEQAKKLGFVLSKEQLKAAENFNDEMLRVKGVLTGVRNIIASRLLPVITRQLRAFQLWWREGNNAERALRALKITAFLVGLVIARIIGASILRQIKLFVTGIWAGVKALKGMGTAASLAALKVWAIFAGLAFIVLAIEDLIGFAQGKDSVIGRLLGDTKLAKDLKKALIGIGVAAKKAWKDIKPALLEAWKAMKPALKELWKAIKPLIGPAFKLAIWALVTAFQMLAITIQIVSAIIKAAVDGFTWAAKKWKETARLFEIAWSTALDTMKSAMSRFGSAVNEQTKKIGIDFNKMGASAARGFQNALGKLGAFFDWIKKKAQAALVLLGLIRGEEFGTSLGKGLAEIGKLPAFTPAGTPILRGLQLPAPKTIFGTDPVGALPGGGLAGIAGPGARPPTTATANVAPGAIVVNVRAEGDPLAIATKINEVVTAKITDIFTGASRDLVKPPPGQS